MRDEKKQNFAIKIPSNLVSLCVCMCACPLNIRALILFLLYIFPLELRSVIQCEREEKDDKSQKQEAMRAEKVFIRSLPCHS